MTSLEYIVLTRTGTRSCAMQEVQRPRSFRPQARYLTIVMVFQCIVICLTFQEQMRLPISVFLHSHKSLSHGQDTKFFTILSRIKSQPVKDQFQDAGRRLLVESDHSDVPQDCKSKGDYQNTFSNSSEASFSRSGNGLKATLFHKPSTCSCSSSAGINFTFTSRPNSNRSREVEERLLYLKCALQRSSSRVGYLLSKKTRAAERQITPYGLHTKHFAILEEALDLPTPEYEELESNLLNEVQNSSEWNEGYESDVWSQPGEYLMNVEVGSPPRLLKGIVDTASDLTWFQCQRCRRCYEQSDPIYEPNNSSTYAEVNCDEDRCSELHRSSCNIFTDGCDYLFTYGDDSFTYGTLSTDTFTLRSSSTSEAREFPRVRFGCSRTSRGSFTHTRADGVVALGGGPLSLASQLGQHFGDRFAYCLVSRWHPVTVTSPIYFGDAAILTGSDAQYTPILRNERYPPYYYVEMIGISVGGERLDISPEVFEIESDGRGGTIVDSGTTFTNLRSEAYDALLRAMNASVQYPATSSEVDFDLCFDISGSPKDAGPGVDSLQGFITEVSFPSLVLHLAGADLNLPLENYMLQVEEHSWCLVIDRSSERLSVIGNVQQQNFRVLYDRENARIGFQRTECHRD